jgi:adenylate cyclase
MARRRFSYPISLAVVVAALIAATGGWIAWWNYRSGVDNVRTLAAAMFDQISREAAGETTSFLLRAPPAAETLAELDRNEATAGTAEEHAIRFVAVLRANPSFTWVSYGTSDGAFVGAVRKGTTLGVNLSRIGADGKTSRDERDVADNGEWLSPTVTEDTKYDPRQRPFYMLAASAKKPVWTAPYVFEGQNVPGISYAYPLIRDGNLAGVFTIDFDLARLSELTRELQFSPNGRVVLVSEDGIVLAHPTAPVVRGTELVRLDTLDDPAVKALRAAGIGATRFELGGETYLARTQVIQMAGGPAWQVLAYAPESDFTAGLRGRVITSLLISLVAVLIAVVVAWILARRVSRPLIGLSKQMEQVGRLDLDDETDNSSAFKEIDMMNSALVKMKGGLRSFARYVPRDLVRTLVASGLDAELTGELRTLTIFFSDLEGFTSLAETKAPDELVKFLGKYFDDVSRIIATEHGTIDKYMGDGIMAFWGAPEKVEDHAVRACVASLKTKRRVDELAKQGVHLNTRIGLATGVVLVGNIGSYVRMNYTVMGDVANLASRIEGLNKQYGTYLMISDSTYDLAKDAVVARAIDVVAVKGKKQGVPVYELLALREENDATAEKIAALSKSALDAYLDRRFDEAAASWGQVGDLCPGDQASAVMRDRALAFVAKPPPPEWTGVWVATSK